LIEVAFACRICGFTQKSWPIVEYSLFQSPEKPIGISEKEFAAAFYPFAFRNLQVSMALTPMSRV